MKLSTTVASSGARSALKNHWGTTKVPQHSNTTTWSTIEETEITEILFLGPLISEPFSGASTCVAIAVYWPSAGLCVPERLPPSCAVSNTFLVCTWRLLRLLEEVMCFIFPEMFPQLLTFRDFLSWTFFTLSSFLSFDKKRTRFKAGYIEGKGPLMRVVPPPLRSHFLLGVCGQGQSVHRRGGRKRWGKVREAWFSQLFNCLGDFVLRL